MCNNPLEGNCRKLFLHSQQFYGTIITWYRLPSGDILTTRKIVFEAFPVANSCFRHNIFIRDLTLFNFNKTIPKFSD